MYIAWKSAAALLLAGLSSSACVKMNTTTTYTQSQISSRTSTEVVEGSREYEAKTRLEGMEIVLALRSSETCRTQTVPVFRKEAHITREAMTGGGDWIFSPVSTLFSGIIFGATGVYSYTNAEFLAASPDNTNENSPEDYRRGGVTLGVIGAGLMTVALVDAVRLRDSHEVVGNVDGPAENRDERCHHEPVRNTAVVVRHTPSQWTAQATTASDGVAHVDLRTLPEAAFVGGALRLDAAVDQKTMELALTSDDAEKLLTKLATDESSRIARDRAARQLAACERALELASIAKVDSSSSDDAVQRGMTAWQTAREQCGSRWGNEQERLATEFRDVVAETAKTRAAARCESGAGEARATLLLRLGEEDELGLDELHSEVATSCQGASNQAAMLAAFDATAKKAQATVDQRARVTATLEKMDACLDANNAVCIRDGARNPEVAALMRNDNVRALLVRLASSWIDTMERGSGVPQLQAQLCASRSLVINFASKSQWDILRAAVVSRHDVVRGAGFAKQLDGSGCK